MPICKTLTPTPQTKVLLWEIEETEQELLQGLCLTDNSINRLSKMKSEQHRKCFLAVRQLFRSEGYQDSDILYNEIGKPYLKDQKYISITHSHHYCGIIIAEIPVGIDIEKKRQKVLKVASKFTQMNIDAYDNQAYLIEKLTIIWSAKESLYKLYGKKKVSLRNDIRIQDFELSASKTFGELLCCNPIKKYDIYVLKLKDFICVYAFDKSK